MALTHAVEEGFEVVTAYSSLQEEQLIIDFFVLLSFPLYFFLVLGHSYLVSDYFILGTNNI